MNIRLSFRLRTPVEPLESHLVSDIRFPAVKRRDATIVHRFEETINGRPYLIEVSRVAIGQWRAQIACTRGGSALMPFYGKTPDEAAGHLSRWLALAHGQARPPAVCPPA